MQNQSGAENTPNKKIQVKTIVGIVLCAILGFILVCNLTIIIKGSVNPDTPPSVFGITPLVVLSGSMSGDADGHIEIGDLIFIANVEYSDLKIGDVVTYQDGKSYTTHRIISIGEEGFITKGDANNTEDSHPLTEEKLVGIVIGRLPAIGNFALFLQTPLGMVSFVGLPLLAFVIYDVIRRQRYEKKKGDKTAELEAELVRLRALAGENTDDKNAVAPEEPKAENEPADADLEEVVNNDNSDDNASESDASEEK